MIKKNILGLLFLLSTLCLFNSCEDDPYYDDRYDLTSALCSGTWAETYRRLLSCIEFLSRLDGI